MPKDKNLFLNIIQNTTKNVNGKKWNCLIDDCEQTSINSHLLQVNGILNNLVENGHLIQIKPNDYFHIEKKGFLSFKSLGIQQAISEYLFCNKHDTEIFKSIEGREIDFAIYSSQLLFSYRSLCCELRKKMKNIEIFTRLRNSNTLNNSNQPFISREYLDLEIKGHKLGVKDMTRLKLEMEKEFLTKSSPNFVFKTCTYPLIKVCVSAVFSPIHPGYESVQKAYTQEQPLNTVFVNVIPQADNLKIILGYHKDYVDSWIIDYVESWDTQSIITLQQNLTNLLTTKVETWSLSPSLFGQISSDSKQKLKDYWGSNAENLLSNQQVNFNLFENT